MTLTSACSFREADAANEIVIETETIKNKLGLPTLVFYYVDWCPYCQKTKPVISNAQKTLGNKVFIYKVDMASEEGKDFVSKFIDRSKGIGTPYMQFYNPEGKLISDNTGPLTQDELTKKIWDTFNIKV